eukprot:comp23627_c0_seq1/m.40266 comp23627_c0_seq1/g.40266  ORF comp23627_c0_seq1/g.40266 comp23627_c0_seq1/m.40266 type:complete len:815 (-) comp23627_c0_seq1:838-3282(-)
MVLDVASDFLTLVDSLRLLGKEDVQTEDRGEDYVLEVEVQPELLNRVARDVAARFFADLHTQRISAEASKLRQKMQEDNMQDMNDAALDAGELEIKHTARELLTTERTYVANLRLMLKDMIEPIKILSKEVGPAVVENLGRDEAPTLLGLLGEVMHHALALLSALDERLKDWIPGATCVGDVFVEHFGPALHTYELYAERHYEAVRVLQRLYSTDQSFVNLVGNHRTVQTPHSVDSLLLLPVQAITRYALLLLRLQSLTDANHPDAPGLERAVALAKKATRQLKLVSIEKNFNLPSPLGLLSYTNEPPKRQFIMEAKFHVRLDDEKTADRRVFLFNDILLVAQHNRFQSRDVHGSYTMVHRVDLATAWLYASKDEPHSLFVGWAGHVLRLGANSELACRQWQNTLDDCIKRCRAADPRPEGTLTVYVEQPDHPQGETSHTVTLNTGTSADGLALQMFAKFGVPDARKYRYRLFSAVGDADGTEVHGASCPLLLARAWGEKDPPRLIFRPVAGEGLELGMVKKGKEKEKGTGKRNTMRKMFGDKKEGTLTKKDPTPAPAPPPAEKPQEEPGLFYGNKYQAVVDLWQNGPPALRSNLKKTPSTASLQQITEQDPSTFIPKPLEDMLEKLYKEGPQTNGIFRKSAHARTMQTVKAALNKGEHVDFSDMRALECGALLKEFFRNLPECIMTAAQYRDFISVFALETDDAKTHRIGELLSQLPRPNWALLKRTMIACRRITTQCEGNFMHAENIAICIGPSILFDDNPSTMQFKEVAEVVKLMVERCMELFGDDHMPKYDEDLAKATAAAPLSSDGPAN